MQLVLSSNRIIAHGENFLAMGGVVINTETGAKYENATIAECEGCPSDIDKVGYEYHAGVFVPCAPFGKGDNNGNFMEVCTTCATPRDSGLPIKDIKWSKVASVTCAVADTQVAINQTLTFPVSDDVLAEYSMLRYKIKAGSYIHFGVVLTQTQKETAQLYGIITLDGVYLLKHTAKAGGSYKYENDYTITFDTDTIFPVYALPYGYFATSTSDNYSRVKDWHTIAGTGVDPLTINIEIPDWTSYERPGYNNANIIIELEGRK